MLGQYPLSNAPISNNRSTEVPSTGGQEQTSKLVAYEVLSPASISNSKLNAYQLLIPLQSSVSKMVAYVILSPSNAGPQLIIAM